jgi:probable F420-dependent oxidoreductase
MVPNIGRVGVWAMDLRFGDASAIDEAAAELDTLGYGALWIPGGIDDAVLGDVDRLLSATKRIAIATGIINIWKQEASDVATWWKGQSPERQARVWLGIGVSHGAIIGDAWMKPVAKTREWLDQAEAAGLPADAICIAALGPKMMALAGKRTGGAHPYLADPSHTATARGILGPGKILAPEQGVVVETDPDKARALAREAVAYYTQLPNYANNWRRLGYSEGRHCLCERQADRRYLRLGHCHPDRRSSQGPPRCRCGPCLHPSHFRIRVGRLSGGLARAVRRSALMFSA